MHSLIRRMEKIPVLKSSTLNMYCKINKRIVTPRDSEKSNNPPPQTATTITTHLDQRHVAPVLTFSPTFADPLRHTLSSSIVASVLW